MKASQCLTTAANLVDGERAAQHGPKLANHKNIADLWNAFLGDRLQYQLSPKDAAMMMALLKIARTKTGKNGDDDYIDAAGYVAIAGELSHE